MKLMDLFFLARIQILILLQQLLIFALKQFHALFIAQIADIALDAEKQEDEDQAHRENDDDPGRKIRMLAYDDRRNEEQQHERTERRDREQPSEMLLTQRGKVLHEPVYAIHAQHPANEVCAVDDDRMECHEVCRRHMPDQRTDEINDKLRKRLRSKQRDERGDAP